MDIFRVIILSTTVHSLAPKDLHLSHMQNTSILFQIPQKSQLIIASIHVQNLI